MKAWPEMRHFELRDRNPDYFVKDRPYLDGIRYPIIGERGTRLAALQAGRLDVSLPTEITKVIAETLKKAAPSALRAAAP